MKKPRIHAELIIAWANGETIQFCSAGRWRDIATPSWCSNIAFRIKPVPELDIYREAIADPCKVVQFLNMAGVWLNVTSYDEIGRYGFSYRIISIEDRIDTKGE